MSSTAKAILAKIGVLMAWAVVALSALVTAVLFADVLQVASGHMEGYPWGWEGGGWPYRSPLNYIISGTAVAAISAAFTVALVLSRRRLLWFAVITGLFIVFVAGLPGSTIAEATGLSWSALLP